ncbi:apolipoprotein D-like [Procambarus clarkii]|uniref:apolipoprotein D-like n=1 Tax=Procambarus clarkii TaxID=6728 RepID=UPI003742ED38
MIHKTCVVVVGVLAALVATGAAHQMMWGSCSTNPFTPFPDFNPQRFNGSWYVIKKLVTSSRCMITTFDLQENSTSFKVQELRTPIIVDVTPYKATVTNEGTLKMDRTTPAKMKLDWSGNILDEVINTVYTVVDTDYDTYAVDLECQSWGIFKRVSATILSRTKELPADKIKELESDLTKYKIDLSRLNTIDQGNCFDPSQVDYNFKIDHNGLSMMGLLGDENLEDIKTLEEAKEYLNITSRP